MLKYISVILCVLLTLLSGCSTVVRENSSDSTMEDLYYFYIRERNLYKYDLKTAEVTPACPDPLCDLGEDCIFYDISYVRAEENTVFFIRCGTDSYTDRDGLTYVKESVCSYNYETGKTAVLCEMDSYRDSSVQGKLDYDSGYVYFYRQTPEPDVTEYSLYRVSEKGGKIEDMGLSVPMWHGAMYDGRLYFWDNINALYSTDLHGNDRRDEIIPDKPGRITICENTDDGFIYYCVNYVGSCEIGKLKLEDHSENHCKTIWETDEGTAASLYRVEKTLYFLLAGEKIPYETTADGQILYDEYGGKIYALSVMGGTPKAVYDEPDTHLRYLRACGDEIMVFCESLTDGERQFGQFVLDK
ncbi:MAG: hypothetical protein ACI4XJ_10825 [Eubacteriales bacterium]